MNKVLNILILIEITVFYIYIIFQIWNDFLVNGIHTFVKIIFSIPIFIFSIGYVCIVRKFKPQYINGNKFNEKIYNCFFIFLRYMVFVLLLIMLLGLVISQNFRFNVNEIIYKIIGIF